MEIDGWFIRSPQRKVVRGWRTRGWGAEAAAGGGCDGDALPLPPPVSPFRLSLLTLYHHHLFPCHSWQLKTRTDKNEMLNKQSSRDRSIHRKVTIWPGFGVRRCWGMPPMHIHYAPPPRSVASSCLNGLTAESSCCRSAWSASPSVCYIHFISPLLAAVSLIHRLPLWL